MNWNCPTCSPTQFRCRSGQCISRLEQCDGVSQCQDETDEENCAPCLPSQFECAKDPYLYWQEVYCVIVTLTARIGQTKGTALVATHRGFTVMQSPLPHNTRLGEVVRRINCRRVYFNICCVCPAEKKGSQHMSLDDGRDIIMVTKPLNPNGSKTTPPTYHVLLSRVTKTATTTCLTMDFSATWWQFCVALWSQTTWTGASSSSSNRYTLSQRDVKSTTKPGDLIGHSTTVVDSYYYSNSPSTVRSYRPYRLRHNIPPPPTTPCSTDVCDDSEPYSSKRYYASFAELDYESDPFYPPPPTPKKVIIYRMRWVVRHHRQRSGVFFNPYPPPTLASGNVRLLAYKLSYVYRNKSTVFFKLTPYWEFHILLVCVLSQNDQTKYNVLYIRWWFSHTFALNCWKSLAFIKGWPRRIRPTISRSQWWHKVIKKELS